MKEAPFDGLAVPKFGVGQSVRRTEDPRLLRGEGRYTDDNAPEGMLHAVCLRSDHAHGVIRSIDVDAARKAPGVRLVVTCADLDAAGYNDLGCGVPLKWPDGRPMIVPPHPSLARDRVRYVGQPVAMIVADSIAHARDAAELVEIDIDPLEPVIGLEAALADGAPQLHDCMPRNLAVEWKAGDHAAAEKAMASAAHVTRLRIVNSRVSVVPMEPRGAIASYEDDRFVIRTGCQGTFGLRAQLAAALGCDVEKVRVLSDDIGGSFGMKASIFPEHVPLFHAARELGQPVKWVNDRSESFLADYHGRDSVFDCELALDAEGNFLAVRIDGVGALGAYVAGFGPAIPTMSVQKNLPSLYRTPVMAITTRAVCTNTTPTTAYRGAGRPEAIYMMERLVDAAARETGRDRVELRRQNMIPEDAFPFAAASGLSYDSGEFEKILDETLELADWQGFEARRREAASKGLLRGIGLCTYLEVTAPQGKEMGGVRFEPDGRVSIITGTLDYGQGHAAPFAQVLADRLGVPFDKIDLVQGDSDELLFGGGTGGSRSLMASGKAIHEASDKVIEQGRQLAAHVLETAVDDIEFDAGSFTVKGTDRSIDIMSLASRLREMGPLPADLPQGLDAALVSETPPSAFPNGTHVAEVEIDPDTGVTRLVAYSAIDDFGNMVNPMLVEGQVHGGLVQAIGQILGEEATYGPDGQLLAGSFMDYTMPRADLVPQFNLEFHPVPAKTNAMGVKGCGEAGITAALPTVMNAIIDALQPLGITDFDMPASPQRVWTAIREARRQAA